MRFLVATTVALAASLLSQCAPVGDLSAPSKVQPAKAPVCHRISLWATTNTSLIGQGASAGATCITVSLAPALDPQALKIDGSGNIWVATEYSSSAKSGGSVVEFSPGGGYLESYPWSACPGGYATCTGYGLDDAEDASNVFAGVTSWATMGPNANGTGFEIFELGEPSVPPTYLSAGTYCSPICKVLYLDVDRSGNLWFDFFGMGPPGCSAGYGLGEVTNPTSDSVVSIVKAPCAHPFDAKGSVAGGVYVSANGYLNITNEKTRKTYQYPLPVTAGSPVAHVLGPTAVALGKPIGGGFDHSDTVMVIGDAAGGLDIGRNVDKAPGKWGTKHPRACTPGCYGAAPTPSDK
jgi:hypothetical protein